MRPPFCSDFLTGPDLSFSEKQIHIMYIDIEREARTNGEFRHGLEQRQAALRSLERQAIENPTALAGAQEALRDFISYCNWNLAFLAGHFWPNYPKGEPLSFADYPYTFQMFELQVGGFMVFRGSRQIGKSTVFCCRQQMLAWLISGLKTMYIVPRKDQLKTYHDRMAEIERAMRGFRERREITGRKIRKNLDLKEFENGSSIEMVYVHTTASNVRGKSADELLFDENQDFDPDLEIEVGQIQSASVMPLTIYAGTSLTTDTMLEKKWSDSSQGYWHMSCGCGHENVPLLEEKVLDMIQPAGLSCAGCSRLLDVRNGRFVHHMPRAFDLGRRGFHVPQVINPRVLNNKVRWADIHRRSLRQGGDRKFLQEILGIPVADGEREITREQLVAICTLGDNLPDLCRKAQQHSYDFVVSGCDWGGSDYLPAQHIKISTTVHVIMGITAEGKFDILYMRRYSGMNYDDIVGDILHNHEVYRGTALASDFGVGAVYNSKLREKIPPQRHLVFGYVGPNTALLSEPKQAHMFNQWSLNKTESLSFTFDAIRSRRIRCFAWEFAEEYLSDCLNLFRAPGEKASSGSGNAGAAATFIYRAHPSKPNDTLMAINYCYMLGKILLREPMFADGSLKIRLEQQLFCGSDDLYFANGPHAFSG